MLGPLELECLETGEPLGGVGGSPPPPPPLLFEDEDDDEPGGDPAGFLGEPWIDEFLEPWCDDPFPKTWPWTNAVSEFNLAVNSPNWNPKLEQGCGWFDWNPPWTGTNSCIGACAWMGLGTTLPSPKILFTRSSPENCNNWSPCCGLPNTALRSPAHRGDSELFETCLLHPEAIGKLKPVACWTWSTNVDDWPWTCGWLWTLLSKDSILLSFACSFNCWNRNSCCMDSIIVFNCLFSSNCCCKVDSKLWIRVRAWFCISSTAKLAFNWISETLASAAMLAKLIMDCAWS